MTRVDRDASKIFLGKCTPLPPTSVLNKFTAIASLIFPTREKLAAAANFIKFLHLLVQKETEWCRQTESCLKTQSSTFDTFPTHKRCVHFPSEFPDSTFSHDYTGEITANEKIYNQFFFISIVNITIFVLKLLYLYNCFCVLKKK